MVICPHCKSHRILGVRPPKDVVVVMPCPACHELIVLFRSKVIALNRRILEQGARAQIITHIADVIGEFLDAGVLPGLGEHGAAQASAEEGASAQGEGEDESEAPLISQEEMERFVKIELKCIDNPSYFKRHFG
jgi:hypothetical protein